MENIVAGYKKSAPIYQPSLFWQEYADKHSRKLDTDGYANFKRTLNLNYFYFNVGIKSKQFFKQITGLLRETNLSFLKILFELRFEDPPKSIFPENRHIWLYKLFMSLLIEKVRKDDHLELLAGLSEPPVGAPFRIYWKGRLISQDILNSILEFYVINEHVNLQSGSITRVAEIGAGYGRLAFVFLSALPAKYAIFDIPPALYVAQRYLSEIFPDRRIFKYRDFNDFEEIREEYENSRVAFFLPHQMELLPPKYFDVFASISSFGEMRHEQINNYFRLIDRLCRGFFYNKQWRDSVNRFDDIRVKSDDYPYFSSWEKIFTRTAPVQNEFFEALYKIG